MTNGTSDSAYSMQKLTDEARRLAADYRRATGKTLPLSPEIATNDAIRLLHLTQADDDTCDAFYEADGEPRKVQVKGRVVFDQGKAASRIGQLKFEKPWDETLLVLMDENYETSEIYKAERKKMESVLAEKSPNKRGAMTVNQFKAIAIKVWPQD